MNSFSGTVGTDASPVGEFREIAGQWQWNNEFEFWGLDCGQWSLFVEPFDGKWAATVFLGNGNSLPVRVCNDVDTMQMAKRWAVMALYEVARVMLDVKLPNLYESARTDEVHTLNGAPFDEWIR